MLTCKVIVYPASRHLWESLAAYKNIVAAITSEKLNLYSAWKPSAITSEKLNLYSTWKPSELE